MLNSAIKDNASIKSFNCEINEIFGLREKRKWYGFFAKGYSGESRPFLDTLQQGTSRYFVARHQDADLGYIRINDKSHYFSDLTDQPVWNISEAYVKPCFRSQNVLRHLIAHVVHNHNVQMLHIELHRYAANEDYYESLGFNWIELASDLCMAWVFQDRFQPILIERKRLLDAGALQTTDNY